MFRRTKRTTHESHETSVFAHDSNPVINEANPHPSRKQRIGYHSSLIQCLLLNQSTPQRKLVPPTCETLSPQSVAQLSQLWLHTMLHSCSKHLRRRQWRHRHHCHSRGASPFAVYKHFMIHASCRHLCDLCDLCGLCGLCAYCGCVDVYMPGAANLNPYLNGPASASKSPGKCTKNTARFLVDSAKPGRTEATKMGKGFAQLVNWYVYVSLPC